MQPVRIKPGIVLVVSLVLTLLLFVLLAYGQAGNTLQVDYIDVGQGDSILLQASDGTDILIDGGPRSAGPTVVAHLQSKGVDDIKVLILTHGDADHVGGLISVLQSAIPVESVIYNGQHHTTLTYQEFLTETQKRGITPTPAQAGQTYTWGPLDAFVLNPQAVPSAEQNENSVVLLLVYGDTRFLFAGDIGSATEQVLLDAVTGTLTLRYQLPADVLKVAHHGSQYSSSAAFLEAVGAEVAVISVGADNLYGYPAQETLDRLRAAGAQVYRTDQDGTLVISTDGQTYEIIEVDYFVFLPLVIRQVAPAAAPTLTPTPTQEPGTTGDVNIIDIFYDGVIGSQEPDEYVEIRNDDTQPMQLSGWTLRDEANHVFTFPGYIMQPGQVCRIYTNENHPGWCGFSYGSGSAIWNNSGDCAYLNNSQAQEMDQFCY
jgi:competence protein ComEC